MTIRNYFIEDIENWHSKYFERVAAYDTLIAHHRKCQEEFEAKKRSELDVLRAGWLKELSEQEAQLFEVAPIFDTDVESIPTYRAAYSDRTAAMMAKIAMLTYIAFEDAEKKKILDSMLKHGKVKLLETLAAGETEVLVAETDKFVVVAFRGSTSKHDLRTDLQARFNVEMAEIGHRRVSIKVHSGFLAAFRLIEQPLQALLQSTPQKPIYLTGHSLGGALALVSSAVLSTNPALADRIAAVYSFGAPRVAQKNFSELVKAPHYRIVNSGDIVPLVPPTWLRRYAHTGWPILLKNGANAPVRRSPRGSAVTYAILSILLWPFTRSFMFQHRHDSSLYVARLEKIARYRGKLT